MGRKIISFIQEITESLYWIQGENNATFPYCHTYLYNDDVLIIFDPNCGKNRLKKGLAQLGKTLSDIDFVINSHFHIDHIGTNYLIKKKSAAKFLIHEADRIAVENFDAYVARYGMDRQLEPQWRATLKMLGYKEMTPDQTFNEDELLPGNFQVVHTPGHSPGHSCFLKSQILLSGDIDLTSPWVGNLSSNVADYLNSLKKLKKLKLNMILPSHGVPIFDNIPHALDKFYQRFLDREEKIYNLLPNHPVTLDELTKRLFRSYSKNQQKQLERRQAFFTFHFGKISCLNFLQHLELNGKVKKIILKNEEYWEKIE